MPVQLTGTDFLATLSNSLLNGLSKVSFAMFLKQNANVVSGNPTFFGSQLTGGVNIYGQLSASNNLLLGRAFPDSAKTLKPALTLGLVYHVVITFDSTVPEQRYYVNGKLFTTVGSAAGTMTDSSLLFKIVSTAGCDFTVDDPVIWSGYILSQAEVTHLRNRDVGYNNSDSYSAVSPGNILWATSLDGTDGAVAIAGNAGLLNSLGSGGFNLVTVSGLPTFRAGNLAYVPPIRLRSVGINYSGKTITYAVEDFNGVLASVQAIVANPTVKINGGSAAALAGPIYDTSNATITYLMPSTILSTDTVTTTAAEGWMTSGGDDCSPFTNLAVTNNVGIGLSVVQDTHKTMMLGTSLQTTTYFEPQGLFANIAKHGQKWSSSNPTLDANNEIVALPNGTASTILVRADAPNGFDAKGYPTYAAGNYTLMWDGAGMLSLTSASNPGQTTVGTPTDTITGAANNKRIYPVTLDASGTNLYGVALFLNATAAPATNIRVYPPGVATDGSDYWHPKVLAQLQGYKVLRFMDCIKTIDSNTVNIGDWNFTNSCIMQTGVQKTLSMSLKQVQAYDNADNFFVTTNTIPMLFTTDDGAGTPTAHGFTTGQSVYFPTAFTVTTNGASFTFGAGTYPLYVPSGSTTTFAITPGRTGGNTVSPSTQSLSGKTGAIDLKYAMSPRDMVSLCQALGANLWINIPHAFTDAACTALANEFLAWMPAGMTLRVEYTDEFWNGNFKEYYYIVGQDRLDATTASGEEWYTKRTGKIHSLFAAAFAAAGRAGDLIRVFASQHAVVSKTTTIANYAATHDVTGAAGTIPIDEFALAPYLDSGPTGSGAVTANWDALDVDQLLDQLEVFLTFNSTYTTLLGSHRSALNAAGLAATKLITYEGGYQTGYGKQTVGSTAAANSRKMSRHPRMRNIIKKYFQQQQDQGASLFVCYSQGGLLGNDANGLAAACWRVWPGGTNEVYGLGDGSDGLFDNRMGYESLDQIVNVIGKGNQEWQANADRTQWGGMWDTKMWATNMWQTSMWGRAQIVVTLYTDIIAYYSFASLLKDSTANHHDLTNNNGVTSVPGKIGSAAKFVAASSQSLSFTPLVDLGIQTQMSVAFWFNATSFSSPIGFFGQDNGSGTDGNFFMKAVTKDALAVGWQAGAGSRTFSNSNTLNMQAGTWYHVVMVYDDEQALESDKLKVYLNGASVTPNVSGTLPATIGPTTDPFQLGVNGWENIFMNGLMDEFALYGRALRQSDAQSLYNSGNGQGLYSETASGWSRIAIGIGIGI